MRSIDRPERALTWAGEPLNAKACGPSEPRGKLDTHAVNGPEDVLDWDAIDWRAHEQNVGRLRRRIFKATREKHPQRPCGLLEPCAATSRKHGCMSSR